ncbi:MAG: glycosyltransferase [Thermoleophilia bacterium]
MNIVFVHNSRPLGGAERYTADLAEGLASCGHAVTVVCPPGSALAQLLERSGVWVVPLSFGPVTAPRRPLSWFNPIWMTADLLANPSRINLYRALNNLVRAQGIDILHAQFLKDKAWVHPYARRHGIQVWWTVHAPLEPWMRRGIGRQVHRRAAGTARVIAVNRATERDLVGLGFAENRIRTIHNGLSREWFSRVGRQERRRLRTALGWKAEEVIALTVARPYPEKGIDLLLDAAQSLTGPPQVRFVVAGESRHRRTFEAQARRRNLDRRVSFLGHRADVPELLQAADLFCLPSYNEGLPYVIAEAMAAGLPVIATRVGGIPEMVVDGMTGRLINVGDAGSLADSVRELALDPDRRRRWGEAGRSRAARRFTLQRMLEETEAAFAECLAATQGFPTEKGR